MDNPPDDWADDYDQYARYEQYCDHAEADIDIVTGQLSCHCGVHRAATTQEIEAEMRWQAEYAQHQHEEALAWEREQHNTEMDARSAT